MSEGSGAGPGLRRVRQLTPREVVFVGGETPKIHQHTSGLTLLDASDRPALDFDAFRKHIEERILKIPHFRWKLHEVPFGLDLPYWVEDEDFDFDNHIRRIAVPAPGDRQALGELVGYLYSKHLDRGRPLWETWFIEGLPDRQLGFFTKLHHSMMDGEGANKLALVLCDFAPDGPPNPVEPAIADARAGEPPEVWRESLTAGWRLAQLPLRAGREAIDGARRAVTQRLGGGDDTAAREPVPTTAFNCDVGRERGFVYGSVSLVDVKTVKNHFGVTVNDMILALVADSLRSYLAERDELPDTSLRTSIAVSLRTADDDDFSNHVTTAGVTLATAVEDPVERLRAIAADGTRAKESAHHGTKGFLELMSILPPALVHVALSVAPPSLVPRAAGFNLVVSNVRGSPVPLYLAGGRVTAMYPMSIIMPGGGINVTCISYNDDIDFGMTIEPTVFPHPWRLIDGLGVALDRYLELTRAEA